MWHYYAVQMYVIYSYEAEFPYEHPYIYTFIRYFEEKKAKN